MENLTDKELWEAHVSLEEYLGWKQLSGQKIDKTEIDRYNTYVAEENVERSKNLLANQLKCGDKISFEDAAYAYRDTIFYITPLTSVFFDGKTKDVDGLEIITTNGNHYYFGRNDDLSRYNMKFHSTDCPFCGAGERTSLENILDSETNMFYISCQSCNGRGPSEKTQIEAIRSWNKRFDC